MSAIQLIVILVAGFVAGMMNSVAGGGSLLSFPALLWIGRDPIVANATNTLAVWPGSLAGSFGYRKEFAGSRQWIILLATPSLIGGLAGAWLLLVTPHQVFAALVPYMILGATALFAAQTWFTSLTGKAPANPTEGDTETANQPGLKRKAGIILFQFVVALYGGYFGAGIGILMLAALGILGLTDIHRMNAVKTLLAMVINGVAAVYFAISGAVNWTDAIVMSIAAIAGGYFGAGIALRVGRQAVRISVIVIGIAMTLSLLFFRK